jgi:hypothetical protein
MEFECSLPSSQEPKIQKVAANKLNKQSPTADNGLSSSLEVVRGANNSSSHSFHPYEHKISSISYLVNKLYTYSITSSTNMMLVTINGIWIGNCVTLIDRN